jgi:hypothetical protein
VFAWWPVVFVLGTGQARGAAWQRHGDTYVGADLLMDAAGRWALAAWRRRRELCSAAVMHCWCLPAGKNQPLTVFERAEAFDM